MTLAAAIQAQMLQTLLSAMQAADQPLKAGETVRAAFAGWATDDGQPPAPGQSARAEALIGQQKIALVLTADAARIRSLQPGAMMTLTADQPPTDGQPAQVRLTAIAPPSAQGADAGVPGSPAAARTASHAHMAQTEPAPAAVLAARAAGPIVGAALGRQDSLAPLLANLAALSAARADPELIARAGAIPQPVLAAAERVLAERLPAAGDAVGVSQLRQAVARSGIFHEAQLARGEPAAAAQDLKSALLTLRAALQSAQGEPDAPPPGPRAMDPGPPDAARAKAEARLAESPPQAVNGAARPAPPSRDGLPAPQPPAGPTIDLASDTPGAVLAKLGHQTDAALDRLSLSQFASLPAPQDMGQGAPMNRWLAEIPLGLPTGAAVLPLEIEEDRAGTGAGSAQAKLWRVRFALDLEPMGLIHALVSMQGKAVSVAVWAEREATSRLVRDFAPDLQAALEEAAFDTGEIEVTTGRPAARPASAGRYLDRVS